MNLTSTLARVGGATAIIALAAIAFSATSHGSQPGWVASGSGSASYLSTGYTAPSAPVTPPQNLGSIGTSVLNTPTTPANCSTTTDPAVPTICSAGGNFPNVRCSVRCDGDADCSVYSFSQTPGAGFCSTLGGGGANYCSVLAPGVNQDDAYCSAFHQGGQHGSQLDCSVFAQAGTFQVCSAQQVPAANFQNQCSAFNWDQADSGVTCSVLDYGARKAACTTITRGGAKECSALSSFSACSILINPTNGQASGKCTALRQADRSTCSVAPGTTGANCSVLNGPSPGPGGTGHSCGFH